MRKKGYLMLAVIFLLAAVLAAGCKGSGSGKSSFKHEGTPRDNTPKVLVPQAPGTTVFTADSQTASMDVSNMTEGYVEVSYSGTCPKVKLLITQPDDVVYSYFLTADGQYETFPLTGGDGTYKLQVMEQVDGDMYSTLMTESIDAAIADPFKPFLYPNQYTWFTADTASVKKAASLAKGAYSDLEVISNIYNYVIENISYDEEKAVSVSADYLPDVDETLSSCKGICFDYAAVMTAMLRSQGIPTKLEIGYSGDVYHAWISSYTKEKGWIDNIIQFDGNSWSLMDPTLAAGNNAKSVGEYIGDGSNYTVKYIR